MAYALYGAYLGAAELRASSFALHAEALAIVAAAGIGLVPSLVQLLEALHCLALSVGIVERRFRDRGERSQASVSMLSPAV
jgi:hypothetical protein